MSTITESKVINYLCEKIFRLNKAIEFADMRREQLESEVERLKARNDEYLEVISKRDEELSVIRQEMLIKSNQNIKQNKKRTHERSN